MHGNEPSDTIKSGEFLVLLSDYQFYKNSPSPRNCLADKIMFLWSNKRTVLSKWTSALVLCNSVNWLGPTENYLLLCHSKTEGRIQRSAAPPAFLKPWELPRISLTVRSHRKSNKMQLCIKILFHIYIYIYMKLNMFWATHRPSSGA